MKSNTLYVAGCVSMDIILGSISNWPSWGTEILTEDGEVRIGGPVTNSAVILASENTDVSVLSAVGDDFFGKVISDGLKNLNIDTSGIRNISGCTPFSVGIKHSDGERAFFSTEGIMKEIELERDFSTLLEAENSHILINGINLIPCFKSRKMIEFLKCLGRKNTVYLDPGWPVNGWTDEFRLILSELLRFCDWFMPNEFELTNFIGNADFSASAVKFSSRFDSNLAVKMGKAGSAIIESGEIIKINTSESDSILDTIGAGDSFNAAFILKKSRGYSSCESASFANSIAKRWIEGYYNDLIKV